MTKIELGDGKYTYVYEYGKQYALRYDEMWRDLTGDKLIYLMGSRIEELEQGKAGLLNALQEMLDYYGWDTEIAVMARAAIAKAAESKQE